VILQSVRWSRKRFEHSDFTADALRGGITPLRVTSAPPRAASDEQATRGLVEAS